MQNMCTHKSHPNLPGHFPHFFNNKANRDYVGPLPPPEAYGVNSMKEVDRAKFMQWHQEQVDLGVEFNLQRELNP